MKARLKPDLFVIIISAVVMLITVCLLYQIVFSFSVTLLIVNIVMVFITVWFLMLMPLYVEKNEKSIILKQLCFKKVFNLEEVEVINLSKKDMSGTVRLFGSGGFFGYIGWHSNRRLGKFYMIANSQKNLILIKTKGKKKYVINFPFENIS